MFLLLAAHLVVLPSARADTFWDVPAEKAAALAATLHRGDILLRWCPGCGDDVVIYRVGTDQVAPGTYSEGQQVQVGWRALAVGPGKDDAAVFASAPSCAEPTLCMADPEAECAGPLAYVDIPYTWRLEPSGSWVWVGALIGLESQSTFTTAPIHPDAAWMKAALACRPVRSRPVGD